MKNRPLLSLVVSSFNDRDIIEPHFEAIRMTMEGQNRYDWEIIYVDDGSMDGSPETLVELASKWSNVTVINFSKNFGQQKAFLAGMKEAQGDIIITLDGDYQYETQCLTDLAQKIEEGFDLVNGIRIKRYDSLFSRLTSVLGRFFVQRALRYPVRDFGAVKAFSRILTDQIKRFEGYSIMPHGMAYALTNRIAEIPVSHRPRFSGKSKWTFIKRLHMYFDLYLAYSPYDATSLVKIGICSLSIGFLMLTAMLYLFLAHDIFFFRSFTAAITLCFIGGGIALILNSFLFSFILRIYRQMIWKEQSYSVREIHKAQSSARKAAP